MVNVTTGALTPVGCVGGTGQGRSEAGGGAGERAARGGAEASAGGPARAHCSAGGGHAAGRRGRTPRCRGTPRPAAGTHARTHAAPYIHAHSRACTCLRTYFGPRLPWLFGVVVCRKKMHARLTLYMCAWMGGWPVAAGGDGDTEADAGGDAGRPERPIPAGDKAKAGARGGTRPRKTVAGRGRVTCVAAGGPSHSPLCCRRAQER
jgi:hypothetical protein